MKLIKYTLLKHIDKDINKGEDVPFVEVPCHAKYFSPAVLKAITLMVNTGKMVTIDDSATKKSKNHGKPIKQVLFRGLKQDEDGDNKPEALRGEVIVLCGKDKEFEYVEKWIAKNPPFISDEGPAEMLQGEGYPGDLWGVAGSTLPTFGFEEVGGDPDGENAHELLKRFQVDCHCYTSPADADSAEMSIEANVFCKES